MNVKVTYNSQAIKGLEKKIPNALIKTADAIKTDIMMSQTMPFDSGNLQNRSTSVDTSDINSGKVRIVSDTPYARRLYFHPEYNFQKTHNPNAGGEWFEPYINGTKKDYAQKVFTRFLKGI